MKESNTNRSSETDWARIDAMTDEEIDTSDIPALNDAFFSRAQVRQPAAKVVIEMSIDPDIVAWFKAQGDEYQRRMNAALRIYVEAHKEYSL